MFPIVVLHGANGSAGEVWALADRLRPYGPVFCPNLLGHGGRPVVDRLTLPDLARDVLAQMDAFGYGEGLFVGYSLGGTLALYLARYHPHRVAGVCGIAAKAVMDSATIDKWVYLVNPARLGRPGNPRREQLARAHFPQAWDAVARMNRAMFESFREDPPLTDADFRALQLPALVLSGDKDQIVPMEETRRLSQALGARGGTFPGAAHPLGAVPLDTIVPTIGHWARDVMRARHPVKKEGEGT